MSEVRIVLAGNPNVGKSTIFNCLTGMHQHTGNWVGKTVANAEGRWDADGLPVILTDAPGCYSLEASSEEEVVARDCICSEKACGVIVVCDGTCLERNLILVLQILRHRRDVILCVNLMDQARRRGIHIDGEKLAEHLGIDVVLTETSGRRKMKKELAAAVKRLTASGSPAIGGPQTPSGSPACDSPGCGGPSELCGSQSCRSPRPSGYRRELLGSPEETAAEAEAIAEAAVSRRAEADAESLKIDRILTNPMTGFPIMGAMLLFIFWLTVQGANYPSELLGDLLFSFEKPLYGALSAAGFGEGVCQAAVFGVYRVLAWVVSVMLPPMAVFFPLFTLLEDWGFLPRVAFVLDRCFNCCGACGKQALTMCMGLGCNASAVVGCRIIDSERERLLAMLTNPLVPCNGRFPLLIAIAMMFFGGASQTAGSVDPVAAVGGAQAAAGSGAFGLTGALCVMAAVMLGVGATFLLTRILSSTLLKGVPSSFTLELPPYRKPRIGEVVIRSVMDRTLFVLGRAVTVAAPAGLVIWALANLPAGGESVLSRAAGFLDPLGNIMGLDGVILVGFILGIPANEIVLPIIMMIYMSQGVLTEIGDMGAFHSLLVENGWTGLTAVNTMLFSLMHWPCATTLLSVKKETGSWKWTAVAFLAPLTMGAVVCSITAFVWRMVL